MKILMVKTSALGDIIHVFPVVSYLMKRFSDVQIDWVVEKTFSALVEAHPHIHRVIQVETKKWRKVPWKYLREWFAARRQIRKESYDVVFDLQGNIKSGLFTLHARAKDKVGFGWKSVPEWPNTLVTRTRFNPPSGQNIRDDYLAVVQSYFADEEPFEETTVRLTPSPEEQVRIAKHHNVNRERIMVCPGSAWVNKQLREPDLLLLLERLEKERDPFFFFVWGNQKEHDLVKRLHLHFPENSDIVERLSLPALQNLMAEMDQIIAVDSLPLHLAGTTSTPTLSFFGPSSAKKYCPKGPQHTTHQGICPYGRTFEKRCPILRTCPDAPCMKQHPLENVLVGDGALVVAIEDVEHLDLVEGDG